MWKELIARWTPHCKFAPPVSLECLFMAEAMLGVDFPTELREFLWETDGAKGEYGIDLIWDLERIQDDNRRFRENADFKRLYMPFDCLLFFADAGNGDQFAFRILDGAVRGPDVYAWNHEDDSRTWVASSLQQFLEWSLDGKIKT